MGDSYRSTLTDRDIEQAITALKKGATLLKYGRRGKPKFCPFRLSNDESVLIWYSGKEEKQLKLSQVSRIIPGQRTAIFQRYPRPEKEYQSFSLIYNDRSLDLICKDKDEAEVWFVGLKALIPNSGWHKWRNEPKERRTSTDGSNTQRPSSDAGNALSQVPTRSPQPTGLGRAFSDMILYTAPSKSHDELSASLSSLPSSNSLETSASRSSGSDNLRVSLSSVVSSSSQGSCPDAFDSLGDVYIWGEGVGEGFLGGGTVKVGDSLSSKFDALLPKALESNVVLDVHHIACGLRHASLVTKQGEIFSWGEESGGRLGHGIEVDVSYPKLIDCLSGMNIEQVACGDHHSCAITSSGDLFTWGDGARNSGAVGHGNETGRWIPKRVCGPLDGMQVTYVSCGPCHTAAVVSAGQLFTFGDGTFGALGHGDRTSSVYPREVQALRGQRTLRVACGAWHTVAIVEVLISEASSTASFDQCYSGKLFTWGEGDQGQLGHGDRKARLVPQCISALMDASFCKVACGCALTVALTTSGRVYTMGSAAHGQIGCPGADGSTPVRVGSKIVESFVEDIACGSCHVAILTSKGELFTWGKGKNGQLGHGDNDHRNEPTFVNFLKDKQVKTVACGSNLTAVICLHKWISAADHSSCTGCHSPFGFRRRRHNCYNCGQLFCKACSSHKSVKASLAPDMNKPYRVCDDCFVKLKKAMESETVRFPRPGSKNGFQKYNEVAEEILPSRLTGLSFVNSLKRTDSGLSKSGGKPGKGLVSPVFPVLNGKFHPAINHPSSPPSPHFRASNKNGSASVPGSRMVSRAASPVSHRSSPIQSLTIMTSHSVPTSPEVVTPRSKYTNDNLRQEVFELKSEVEKLTCNKRLLETELEKTRKQLEEAKILAANEAEKSKAAKEVIKSLTAQLKQMAEKVQEANIVGSKLDSHSGQSSGPEKDVSHGNHLTGLLSPTSESNVRTIDALLINGATAQPQTTEWVVQDEPGVYITLSSLPGGHNELKRVRFSRKRFSEEQAQKWWSENSNRVCERHNIRNQ